MGPAGGGRGSGRVPVRLSRRREGTRWAAGRHTSGERKRPPLCGRPFRSGFVRTELLEPVAGRIAGGAGVTVDRAIELLHPTRRVARGTRISRHRSIAPEGMPGGIAGGAKSAAVATTAGVNRRGSSNHKACGQRRRQKLRHLVPFPDLPDDSGRQEQKTGRFVRIGTAARRKWGCQAHCQERSQERTYCEHRTKLVQRFSSATERDSGPGSRGYGKRRPERHFPLAESRS